MGRWRVKPSNRTVAFIAAGIWTFTILMQTIGPLFVADEARKDFFNFTGCWCFVSNQYRAFLILNPECSKFNAKDNNSYGVTLFALLVHLSIARDLDHRLRELLIHQLHLTYMQAEVEASDS